MSKPVLVRCSGEVHGVAGDGIGWHGMTRNGLGWHRMAGVPWDVMGWHGGWHRVACAPFPSHAQIHRAQTEEDRSSARGSVPVLLHQGHGVENVPLHPHPFPASSDGHLVYSLFLPCASGADASMGWVAWRLHAQVSYLFLPDLEEVDGSGPPRKMAQWNQEKEG